MNTILFHLAGGDAFFSGFTAVAFGALIMAMSRGKQHRIGSAAILLGWILVVASATAFSISYYVVLGITSLLSMTARPRRNSTSGDKSQNEVGTETESQSLGLRSCSFLCLMTLGAIVFEFVVYHPSSVQISSQRPIIVIGDSLSAGINDGVDIPWPEHLDAMTSQNVSNNAVAGATSRTALKQLTGLPKQCVVLVEIGGNDLLSGRSSSEFRADLDELLTALQTPERNVVIFELPLPPLFNGYGYAQRELAAKYGVTLIPRRLLASVLFSQNATLDSIHLSNDGHRQLAERVAEFLSLDDQE